MLEKKTIGCFFVVSTCVTKMEFLCTAAVVECWFGLHHAFSPFSLCTVVYYVSYLSLFCPIYVTKKI